MQTVGVVEPALGQHDVVARSALPAAGCAELADRERRGVVELGEQGVELGEGRHGAEGRNAEDENSFSRP